MKARHALELLRHYGPRRIGLRMQHARRVKSGFYEQKQPVQDWSALPRYSVRAVFPVPEVVEGDIGGPEDILLFGWDKERWNGDWNANPLTGRVYEPVHWSRIPLYSTEMGDIKWAWEAGRFDWVCRLIRGHLATGDPAWTERFWELFSSWKAACPPFRGVQWACAQECSYRIANLCLASSVLPLSQVQKEEIGQVIGVLAERVELTLGYALSQQNTHALMEPLGLFLAGNTLPEHPKALSWREAGRRIFLEQATIQFTENGDYTMVSAIYWRAALTHLLCFARASQFLGETVPDMILRRMEGAARALAALMDSESGRVSNFGANDGTHFLALSGEDYLDFRCVLRDVGLSLDTARVEGSSLHSLDTRRIEGPRDFHILRRPDSHLILRKPIVHSPYTQADLLHVDLWVRGQNVLRDGGTYLYCDPTDTSHWFKSTSSHNTVTVDDQSQMEEVSRFQWGGWPREKHDTEGAFGHTGYQRLGVSHERALGEFGPGWSITDLISGTGKHCFTWTWLVGGAEDWEWDGKQLKSATLGTVIDFLSSSPMEAEWDWAVESLYYGRLDPVRCLRIGVTADLDHLPAQPGIAPGIVTMAVHVFLK